MRFVQNAYPVSVSGLFILGLWSFRRFCKAHQNKADHGGGADSDSRALADKIAGVGDQFVNILAIECCRGSGDRFRGIAGLIAILAAHFVVDTASRVVDQF